MNRRALVSVSDKTGLAELARGLHDLGYELVASGSTAAALEDAGIPVVTVESVTGSPEMLDGRVKTLHPKVHGGILADRGNSAHRADLERQGIEPFDLVVSNLYPFVEVARDSVNGAFDREIGRRLAEAAHRLLRRLVRHHRNGLVLDRGDLVRPADRADRFSEL